MNKVVLVTAGEERLPAGTVEAIREKVRAARCRLVERAAEPAVAECLSDVCLVERRTV